MNIQFFKLQKYWDFKFEKTLKNKFPNTFKFCDCDLNKFMFRIRKRVYPYECMDSWTKFDESSLPIWDTFYSKLNIEDNSEPNYKHPKMYGVPLK